MDIAVTSADWKEGHTRNEHKLEDMNKNCRVDKVEIELPTCKISMSLSRP